MPFNFVENKQYTIDYISLFEYLNTYRFIRNTNIQRTFLEHWLIALWEADNIKEIDMSKKDDIYQQPIYYGEIEFYVHFNVTKCITLNKQKESITLSSFICEDSKILRTPTISSSDNHEIILVEFPRSEAEYIVISGQQYLEQCIKDNQSTIQITYLNSEDIIQNNCLCSQFDLYYYHFTLELHQIFQKYGKLKFNELQILRKSFLNNTTHKFQ